jgi:hypothetical protein
VVLKEKCFRFIGTAWLGSRNGRLAEPDQDSARSHR